MCFIIKKNNLIFFNIYMSFANYKKINPTTGQREVDFGSISVDLNDVEVGTLSVLNNLSAPEIDNIILELQEIKNDIISTKEDIELKLQEIKNDTSTIKEDILTIKNDIINIKEDLAVIFDAINIDKNNKSIETNYSLTVKGDFSQG